MRPWLYVITWEALWHMQDVCYKCKVETHGVCVPTQIGARCACQRGKCRGTVKPAGGGFEHSDTNRTLPDNNASRNHRQTSKRERGSLGMATRLHDPKGRVQV